MPKPERAKPRLNVWTSRARASCREESRNEDSAERGSERETNKYDSVCPPYNHGPLQAAQETIIARCVLMSAPVRSAAVPLAK